jgi:hypothetical protein
MPTLRVVGLAGFALIALAACSKADNADKPAAGSAASAAAVGGGRDAVLDAWKADKLVPSGLTPVAVPVGKDCQTGTVEGIEVLLCNFGSPADAKAAEDQGLTWIGQVTGSSQAHGSTLVVLADRRKADPNGKTINRLMKLAPK